MLCVYSMKWVFVVHKHTDTQKDRIYFNKDLNYWPAPKSVWKKWKVFQFNRRRRHRHRRHRIPYVFTSMDYHFVNTFDWIGHQGAHVSVFFFFLLSLCVFRSLFESFVSFLFTFCVIYKVIFGFVLLWCLFTFNFIHVQNIKSNKLCAMLILNSPHRQFLFWTNWPTTSPNILKITRFPALLLSFFFFIPQSQKHQLFGMFWFWFGSLSTETMMNSVQF